MIIFTKFDIVKSLWTNIIVLLFLAFAMPVAGQSSLPEVFLIGEHEAVYESKIKDYNVLLLTVCNNSMDEAYDKWSGMLIQMEEYADSIDYDIKGAKIWINVFWNKSGTIDHIIYYPKPNSKNMDFDRFTAFLREFTTMYQMKVESSANFSHYGSASFPTHAKLTGKSK